MIKKIAVAMSTYNGATYLKRQIDSILNQEGVNVFIHIRDDGSTDDTVAIIENYVLKFPNKISLERGNNVGSRKSFIKALENCPCADYYAFSDQDDVWLPTKCFEAIKKIENMSNIALYASSLMLVNEQEDIIGSNNICNMKNCIESFFARQRIAGCTFLFTPQLREKSLEIANGFFTTYPDHDFVVGACGYAYGDVFLDKESYILHRRLKDSQTAGGNGFMKRMRVEKKVLFGKKKVKRDMAINLLNDKLLREKNRHFLNQVAVYDRTICNKLKLINNTNFHSHNSLCDLETYLKILIETY